jgi:hypothetical protein
MRKEGENRQRGDMLETLDWTGMSGSWITIGIGYGYG